MKRSAYIWLIVAAALVVAGAIILGGVMTVVKWDISKLATDSYEIKEYEVEGEFGDILISGGTADVRVALSDEPRTRVVCSESEHLGYAVTVDDGTLKVERRDTRKWYERIGIVTGEPILTVYLPAAEYGRLVIKNSTGDVEVSRELSFGSIDISLSTGDVKNYASAGNIKINVTTGEVDLEEISADSVKVSVTSGDVNMKSVACSGDISIGCGTGDARFENVRCGAFTTTGSTGEVLMKDLVASGKITVRRSTGEVRFDDCDADSLNIRTTTGSVKGSLLSQKVFEVSDTTGRVSLPSERSGGECRITVSTGDIIVKYSK